MNNGNQHNSKRAKARWKLLAEALKKTKQENNAIQQNQHSVRRFAGFDLFDIVKCGSDSWLKYTPKHGENKIPVNIRLSENSVTAEDLIGFNNTGNVCVWPSEEVLAYYSTKHKHIFKNKSVCELGGGMTCLAGLQIALQTEAKEILVTDGNQSSVANLKLIIEENLPLFQNASVLSRELIWNENSDDYSDLHAKFDVIVCADSLFFVNVHNALVQTIKYVMKDDGVCIILAPKRSDTFKKFTELASHIFKVDIVEQYDDMIWDLHGKYLYEDELYAEDLHYPILIKMHNK